MSGIFENYSLDLTAFGCGLCGVYKTYTLIAENFSQDFPHLCGYKPDSQPTHHRFKGQFY